MVNSKNKCTLPSPGRRGFLGETPQQKHLADTKRVNNSGIHHSFPKFYIFGFRDSTVGGIS